MNKYTIVAPSGRPLINPASIYIQSSKMCRMCSYYTRIDIRSLSTSNPFSTEYLSPAEPNLPNNITIESPESQRHTVWTNLQRFPSPNSYAAPGSTRPSCPSPATITIRGPTELAKLSNHSNYKPYRPQNHHPPAIEVSHLPTSSPSTISPRRLQRRNRVDSLQSIYPPESGHSLHRDTPELTSPVSEDEFLYLPSSPNRVAKLRYTLVARDALEDAAGADMPASPPQGVGRAENSSSTWMNEICRNL